MIEKKESSESGVLNPLSPGLQALFLIASFLIVAFGQPAWSWICGILSGIIGYALFWRVLLGYPLAKHRFWLSTVWFGGVQLVQLSWLVSHPYLYIYGLYFFFSFFLGLQFGCLGVLVNPAQIGKVRRLLAMAGLWTLMEWIRLFILSGFSWNPIGLALTGNIYSLQMASLWGVYGLSFWVFFVNLLALRALYLKKNFVSVAVWAVAALLPYLYGLVHIQIHTQELAKKENRDKFHAVLVQTAFPVEESLPIWDSRHMIAYVLDEWRQILTIIKHQKGKTIDLIALPEFTVPYGTYTPIYTESVVKEAFEEILGPDSVNLSRR